MKYFVTTVLTLLLGFCTSWAQSFNQLVSRNLSSRDGLSSNQVYDMLQDKRGYLWFATTNGISRYDGYSFLNFNVLNAPLPKPVQASMGRINYDPKNDLLWATTSNFHVACYSMLGTRFLDYTGKGDYQRQYLALRQKRGYQAHRVCQWSICMYRLQSAEWSCLCRWHYQSLSGCPASCLGNQ